MTVINAKFPRNENTEFYSTLRLRVNKYFKDKGISKKGDRRLYFKTAALLAMYFVPYSLIMFQVSDSIAVKFILWMLFGFGLAGLGLSVMHDAVHGAYSSKKWINEFFANVMVIIGGSKFTWNVQHNQKHHSYTNIDGIDEDIDPGVFLRFSPHKKRYGIHRLQHLYAWFFYGIQTLSWSTEKDFRQIFKYKKAGSFKGSKTSFSSVFFKILFSKIVFQTITLVLPLIYLSDPWYLILLYNFSAHFVAGLVMACVFQPAHVMPEKVFPLPDENGSMENNWAIHQLLTTANYSPNSKLLYWYVGGLTHQIEHHLFPNVCHVHYKEISKIVKATTAEFGLPYHVQPTFYTALKHHTHMLKILGKYDELPVIA